MTGKYASVAKYHLARAKWSAVRAMLGAMSGWSPIENAEDGYTIVIGCAAGLLPILSANLEVLSRQDLRDCREILCVVDAPRERLAEDIEPRVRERWGSLPLRFLYYTRWQHRVLNWLGYPAGFCWFSWQLGLGRVRTRHVLLHDFDAFPLRPGLIRERYMRAKEGAVQWLGQRYYQGNGVERSDGLVTTFEMVLDAELVRRSCRPIELFNRVTTFRGRTVEFDITLEAQSRFGRSEALDMPEEELVHPSQVVHQFTELTHIEGYVPPPRNRLPFVPYLLYLGEGGGVLASATAGLDARSTFELGGREVSLRVTDPEHVTWLRKQAGLIEAALFGEMRAEVAAYFDAVEAAVGRVSVAAGDATVGRAAATTS